MDELKAIYGDAATRRYEAWLGDRGPPAEDPGEAAFKAGFMAGAEIALHDAEHYGRTPGCAYCERRA